jgi:hypothetical protein
MTKRLRRHRKIGLARFGLIKLRDCFMEALVRGQHWNAEHDGTNPANAARAGRLSYRTRYAGFGHLMKLSRSETCDFGWRHGHHAR